MIEVYDQREYRVNGWYSDSHLGRHRNGRIGAYQDEASARAAAMQWLDANGEGEYDRIAMLYRLEIYERKHGDKCRRIGHGRGRELAWWLIFGNRHDASSTSAVNERLTPAHLAARMRRIGVRGFVSRTVRVGVAAAGFLVPTFIGAAKGGFETGLAIGGIIGGFLLAIGLAVSWVTSQQTTRELQRAAVVTKQGPVVTVQVMRGETYREAGGTVLDWRQHAPDYPVGEYVLLFGDEKVQVDDEQGRRLARLGPLESATVSFFRAGTDTFGDADAQVLEVVDAQGTSRYRDPGYFPRSRPSVQPGAAR